MWYSNKGIFKNIEKRHPFRSAQGFPWMWGMVSKDHTGDSLILKSGAEFTAVNCIYVTFVTTVFLMYKMLYNKS